MRTTQERTSYAVVIIFEFFLFGFVLVPIFFSYFFLQPLTPGGRVTKLHLSTEPKMGGCRMRNERFCSSWVRPKLTATFGKRSNFVNIYSSFVTYFGSRFHRKVERAAPRLALPCICCYHSAGC